MAKPNLKLFTLLTSVRLEKETSGIKKPGEYSKGDEVEVDELYGRGLESNRMAVAGKVEPEPEPADIEPVSGGYTQEDVDLLVQEESDKLSDLQSQNDALVSANSVLQEDIDRLTSELEKVTQPQTDATEDTPAKPASN